MSKFDEQHQQQQREKFGIEKLAFERVRSPVQLETNQIPPSRHEAHFMDGIKQKYNVSALQCEGLLGTRLAERNETTLEEFSRVTEQSRLQGMKLAIAKVDYQNKPIKLFYEIRY